MKRCKRLLFSKFHQCTVSLNVEEILTIRISVNVILLATTGRSEVFHTVLSATDTHQERALTVRSQTHSQTCRTTV